MLYSKAATATVVLDTVVELTDPDVETTTNLVKSPPKEANRKYKEYVMVLLHNVCGHNIINSLIDA